MFAVLSMDEAEVGEVENPYRYSTKEWDEKSGLYYFGARYYSPEISRWTQRDPLGRGNLYQFLAGNPLSLVDPWGLEQITLTFMGKGCGFFHSACHPFAKRVGSLREIVEYANEVTAEGRCHRIKSLVIYNHQRYGSFWIYCGKEELLPNDMDFPYDFHCKWLDPDSKDKFLLNHQRLLRELRSLLCDDARVYLCGCDFQQGAAMETLSAYATFLGCRVYGRARGFKPVMGPANCNLYSDKTGWIHTTCPKPSRLILSGGNTAVQAYGDIRLLRLARRSLQ